MTPTQRLFADYSDALTARQDVRERIIKISRDTTTASKRAIFLLHRITSPSQTDILDEAQEKIDEIHELFAEIARELKTQPAHLYASAYSPGVQEYVEAVTFLHFCKTYTLLPLDELNSHLVFPAVTPKEDDGSAARDVAMTDAVGQSAAVPSEAGTADGGGAAVAMVVTAPEGQGDALSSSLSSSSSAQGETIRFVVSPRDYMLGVADLTGECMRMCINALGDRDEQRPFRICNFVRGVFEGFKMLGPSAANDRDLGRKVEVLEGSLKKIEDACYNLIVRGEEMPKDRLADAIMDMDEGPQEGSD